jgi:DNA-binding transcriptional LysR family regulator
VPRSWAAETELAAHVGLRQGRVRLAAFPSALGTFVPAAAARLAAGHPGLELRLTEAEPPEAVRMLRAGHIDVAVIFRYDDGVPEDDGIATHRLLEDPTYLVAAEPPATELAAYADGPWIAGCDRCRMHLLELCARTGFEPSIAFTTDDFVAVQAMVAAGLGVATLPGLALRAARHPDVRVVALPDSPRYVLAATYGSPPHPPATGALLAALTEAAAS